MENVIKIRCPHCAGKIGIEGDYYDELVGSVIACPHCANQMIVPANAAGGAAPMQPGSHSLDRTQEIQVPPEWNRPFQGAAQPARSPVVQAPAPVSPPAADDVRRCPYCHEEVGKRDRICISCGHKIPISETPPPGFSQIRA